MRFLLSGAMLFTLASAVHAQITWNAPSVLGQQTISGNYTGADTDISTNGGFVAAVTEADGLGAGNYPVVVSDAGTTFDLNNDSYITNIGGGGSDGSHSTATAYQSALDGVAYTFGAPVTFTLTGLNASDTYQVEIWNVDSSTSRNTEYSSTGTAGTTTVDVYKGFVIGTFSGETSQSISFQPIVSGGAGEVDAVALRDLSVPEPSTYAMLFGGLGMVVLISRLRRNLSA
jgi:hypothetical protein